MGALRTDLVMALHEADDAARPVARWDGCRESNFGASFYSNVNRKKELQAAKAAGPVDAGKAAVERMFKYLQSSNQDIIANFAKFDEDGSGELDVDEFVRGVNLLKAAPTGLDVSNCLALSWQTI